MRKARGILLLGLAGVLCAPAADTIGIVDFYGYGGLDPANLRAVLPFHEGDPLPSDKLSARARDALQRFSGRPAVEVSSPVLGSEHWTVYIGLADPAAPPILYNSHPTSDLALPPMALKLFRQMDKDLFAAVKRGAVDEDDSTGYTLTNDAATRQDQSKLHEWARANTAVLYRVLEQSRHIDQRLRAAEALGYAEHSSEQVAALVRAAFDDDAGVRNAAIRALNVLCRLGAEVTRQIPAARFIPLLYSLHWTDRNKSSWLLDMLTAARDPALLEALHDRAVPPLREMLRWKDKGHAMPAAMILGRIAGLPDAETGALLDAGDTAAIVRALR